MAKPSKLTIARRVTGEWPEKIRAAWQKSVEGILETARLLIQAKADKPGEFVKMIETELPFNRKTAHKLMSIGKHAYISDVSHVRHLPASWGTLYELTRLDSGEWAKAERASHLIPWNQKLHGV